jgi:hypothetical protein
LSSSWLAVLWSCSSMALLNCFFILLR